jgi:hypothetical protein
MRGASVTAFYDIESVRDGLGKSRESVDAADKIYELNLLRQKRGGRMRAGALYFDGAEDRIAVYDNESDQVGSAGGEHAEFYPSPRFRSQFPAVVAVNQNVRELADGEADRL